MAEKFQIRIILKNSSEFTVKCDEFNCRKNGLGQLTGISWVGGTENIPLFLDINEIVAIIQLDTILSADVAPMKHGHWILLRESEITGFNSEFAGRDPIGGYQCSNCKEEAIFDCNDEFVLSSYCPNCGAKMDGG